jgi:ribonuclease HII
MLYYYIITVISIYIFLSKYINITSILSMYRIHTVISMNIESTLSSVPTKPKRTRTSTASSSSKKIELLEKFYDEGKFMYEICIDEVGRGPLFGRLYTAAVVLPRNTEFDGSQIKDSKRFSSKAKMKTVAEYIGENALFTHIHFIENTVIDEINILQSVYKSMHENVKNVLQQIKERDPAVKMEEILIVVDGDRFRPYCVYDENTESLQEIAHVTVEKGDATYMGIAAASIIAKVAHDEYIYDLCDRYPELDEKYGIRSNVGYGTKRHIDGIIEYGMTEWHRKTYCKGKYK